VPAFTPMTMYKGGASQVADNPREYIELLYDGWTTGNAAPAASTFSASQKSEVQETALDEIAKLAAWAKDLDSLVVGSVTRNASGHLQGAQVVWPDGATGILTATTRAEDGAVMSYTITRVTDAGTSTYTQPTITRDSSGAATNVPQMTVV
jgi:hypothetical protein